jgi:hypothetical protein
MVSPSAIGSVVSDAPELSTSVPIDLGDASCPLLEFVASL